MLVVIGSTTLDLFLTGFDVLPVAGEDEFTPDSIALTDDPPAMLLGGNAANTAFVASGLGIEAAVCSTVGDDAAGSMLVDWLDSRQVCLDGLRRAGPATSMTVVATDKARHRLAFHHPGLGRSLGLEDIPPALLERATTVLLSGYHLMTGMRGAAASEVLESARGTGAVTAVDVGPIVSPLGTLDELSLVVPHVDYVIGNRYELETSTGRDGLAAAADVLLEAGAGAVVAKLGPQGAASLTPDRTTRVAAFPVEVVSTVGAGDSFNAGFLTALSRGDEVEAALRFGNAVAALVISRPAGVLGAPSLNQVTALMAPAN